jgi:hypothetical protein
VTQTQIMTNIIPAVEAPRRSFYLFIPPPYLSRRHA